MRILQQCAIVPREKFWIGKNFFFSIFHPRKKVVCRTNALNLALPTDNFHFWNLISTTFA